MSGLPPNQQKLKEIFDSQSIPVVVCEDWNEEYLSVPIIADAVNHQTVSARFGFVMDGQPVLTDLPRGRYLCVRIPSFYLWWDDLNNFSHILQEANSIAYSLMQRDAYLDFFIDFVYCDTIFFRMDVPLKENEEIDDATLNVFDQLNFIVKSVYSYLKKYDDEYDEEASQQ